MLFYFTMSRNNSDQHFADLIVSAEFWNSGTMPAGCTIFIDEQQPENCRLNFDAGIHDRRSVCAMLAQYLMLLNFVARQPQLPISRALMLMRWDDALSEVIDEDKLHGKVPHEL
jgi:hypothetical protein